MVGDEVVLRVSKTGKSYRITQYDGTGLADGYSARRHLRYISGEGACWKAHRYAIKKAKKLSKMDWVGGKPVRYVPLGQRMSDYSCVVAAEDRQSGGDGS